MCAYRNNPNIEVDIPPALAHLRTAIFESLPNSDAMGWPLRFMNAIAPGADLALVEPEFNRWMLDSIALPSAGSDEAVRAAIRGTIEVFDRWIATGTVDKSMAHAAYRAANRAALDAANSAASRAARCATYAAHSATWDSAGSATAAATRSAAHSAAYSAARSALYAARRGAANRAAHSAAYSAAAPAAITAAYRAAYQAMADKLLDLIEAK